LGDSGCCSANAALLKLGGALFDLTETRRHGIANRIAKRLQHALPRFGLE
jgi:hypothetical protein